MNVEDYMVSAWLWLAGLLITTLQLLWPSRRTMSFQLGLIAILVAMLQVLWLWIGQPGLPFNVRPDGFALFVQAVVLVSAGCGLLLGRHQDTDWPPGADGLLLLATAGAALLASAVDLVVITIGFVATLVPLLGLAATSPLDQGREGALKGFVASALGTGLLGLGTAVIFLLCGTTTLEGIGDYLTAQNDIAITPLLTMGIALVLSGAGVFLAIVPFHMWYADMIEGLPGPAGMLLSGGVLACGLAAISRMILFGFLPALFPTSGHIGWLAVLHGVGLAALLVGNALALTQQNLKRLLAFIATGQVGLVLVTLAAIGERGAHVERALGGLLVFLAIHSVNWVALFVAVAAIGDEPGNKPVVTRLQGLAWRRPWLATAIGLALLCMAGMPSTAGFFSRLYLLDTLVEAGFTTSAVLAALSLGLVLVMGLRLVAAMVIEAPQPDSSPRISTTLSLAAALTSLMILVFGLLPGGLLNLAIQSATTLTATTGLGL
jgi:NADH-quinone oxidoreductase subunit N